MGAVVLSGLSRRRGQRPPRVSVECPDRNVVRRLHHRAGRQSGRSPRFDVSAADPVAIHLINGSCRDDSIEPGNFKNATNPTATAAGVFGGQLTAAKLNVAFDQAGVFDAIKPNDALKLGDLVFIANVHAKLIGLSVSEVILLSDNAISGAVAMPLDVDNDGIGDVGFADLSNALDKLNNEFDNGNPALGSLGIGSGL